MNIKNEIMEEWEDSFIASDEEQTHDAYPYNIKPFIHEEITKFLSQALTRIEEAKEEAGARLMLKIANLEREHDNDWPAGQEWEDLAPSSQSTFKRIYREYLASLPPSEEKMLGHHTRECSFIKYDTGVCDCSKKEKRGR